MLSLREIVTDELWRLREERPQYIQIYSRVKFNVISAYIYFSETFLAYGYFIIFFTKFIY